MKIKTSVGKITTTLQWQFLEENVSLKFQGRVDAEYSESKKLVIVAGVDGVIRLLSIDGKQILHFGKEYYN